MYSINVPLGRVNWLEAGGERGGVKKVEKLKGERRY
jgi:hypothetical protein